MHVEEILGTAIMGSQLVVVPPNGHLDMEILAKTIYYNQVTYLSAVPSQITELTSAVQNSNGKELQTLNCISAGGKQNICDIASLLICFF